MKGGKKNLNRRVVLLRGMTKLNASPSDARTEREKEMSVDRKMGVNARAAGSIVSKMNFYHVEADDKGMG